MSNYKHPFQPFNYLADRAEENAEGLLFDGIDVQASNSFAYVYVKKLSNLFRELGIKKGDTIALDLPGPLHIMFMLATWHEAAISVAIAPLQKQNLSWLPDWLFTTEEYPKSFAKNIIKVHESFSTLIENQNLSSEPKYFDSKKSIVKVLFSSGTTGAPKAIPITIGQLEARQEIANDYWFNFGSFMSCFRLTAIGGFPAFFFQLNLNLPYLLPRDSGQQLKLINKHDVTALTGSPNQILDLVELVERSGSHPKNLRNVLIGGSKISVNIAERIERVLSTKLINTYGATETGFVSRRVGGSLDPSDLGEISKGVSVKIFDMEFNESDEIKEGLIGVKSPQCVFGYFRDEESTDKFFKNGWFFSGDIGRIEGGNHLFLDGRIDERINSGGIKIDPTKIENYIVGKFQVLDSGGFSYEGEKGIELFGLGLVSNEEIDFEAVMSTLVSEFQAKAPSKLFQIDKIPRNENGKIDRVKLKEIVFKV